MQTSPASEEVVAVHRETLLMLARVLCAKRASEGVGTHRAMC